MNGGGRPWPPAVTQAVVWWLPRALFVGSALLLAVAAAAGWSPAGLTAALVLFGLCSALFVGRQLVRGRAPSRGLVIAAVGLCVAGAGVLIAYMITKDDVLPLVGAVLVLLGVGWLVEKWRASAGDTALLFWGIALLVVAVVAAGAAAALFFRGSMRIGPALVVTGIALVLGLPVGLNLLSQRGLNMVATLPSTGRSRRTKLTGAAAIVLAAAVGFCCYLVVNDWLLTAAAVGIVLVLVLAIVSDTHADVAVLLAVLALLAAAPLESAHHRRRLGRERPQQPGGARRLVHVRRGCPGLLRRHRRGQR